MIDPLAHAASPPLRRGPSPPSTRSSPTWAPRTSTESASSDAEEIYRGRYMVLEKDRDRPSRRASNRRATSSASGGSVIAPLDAMASCSSSSVPPRGNGAMLELPAGTRRTDASWRTRVAAPARAGRGDGLSAAGWSRLAGYYSAPGFLTEYLSLFLATDLRRRRATVSPTRTSGSASFDCTGATR